MNQFNFAKFKEGNERVLTLVHKMYYRALIRYALSFVKDINLAEDIVGRSFLQLWLKRKTIKNEEHLRNFLYTVTRMACYSHFKNTKEQREKLIDPTGPAIPMPFDTQVHPSFLAPEEKELERKLASLLTKSEFTVVKLMKEGRSIDEIAGITGQSRNNVKVTCSHALQKIRENRNRF
jgi:RNA polymerase sigma factor (sigma-70 family)